MTNRRSILSTLCTGSLALLAPVAAWAKPRRWVGFHNRGIKPMVITPYKDLTPEQIAEFKRLWNSGAGLQFRCQGWETASFPSGPTGEYPCSKCGQPTLHDEPDPNSLRALLAEAKGWLHGALAEPAATRQRDLRLRIDDALKGDKRNA